MYWFTADEHLGHKNIIEYCNRPFDNAKEMNNCIIDRHNEVVKDNDIVIHCADFTIENREKAEAYIRRLKGRQHIFLRGSHDYWLKGTHSHEIWEKKIGGNYFVACHYLMYTWPRSHYGSFLCFGHSHGKIKPFGKQHDVGVDNNNFYPISSEQLVEIMKTRPNNPNLISNKKENNR